MARLQSLSKTITCIIVITYCHIFLQKHILWVLIGNTSLRCYIIGPDMEILLA